MDNKTFNILQKAMSKRWVSLVYEDQKVIVKPLRWEGYNVFVLCGDGLHKRRLDYDLIQSPRLIPATEIPSPSTDKRRQRSSRKKARETPHEKPTSNPLPPSLVSSIQTLGQENEGWLKSLWDRYRIRTDVLVSDEDEVLAEPLFWFKTDNGCVSACFGREHISKGILNLLEDHDIRIIAPGDPIP